VQIFTNSDKNHAATVLEKLGLEGCFDAIICFETLNPAIDGGGSDATAPPPPRRGVLCKPSLESMEAVIEIAKLDAKRTVTPITYRATKPQ
jgi:putative hydrolase of the HAD superfamily/pyrimidine and pyridine-specific 5'-nucleotidase